MHIQSETIEMQKMEIHKEEAGIAGRWNGMERQRTLRNYLEKK